MIDIEHELWRAVRFRDAARIPFPLSNRVQWGFARVSFYGRPDRRCYEPEPKGDVMAFIAPVVEQGELIDLAAIDQHTDRVAMRLDLGQGLGLDVIEQARLRAKELWLVPSAMAWLADPIDTVWLRDISKIGVVLDGVDIIRCQTIPLAERVMAFLPPSQQSRVLAPLK